ncbi:Uncharacterised protein (plasmid) [Tsukamurella tyrosinosolvens]|uniref:hypothetical protein n=1 Tax=Tsukamurella tyrosinosolvens TaxID=57704 RepID=UPI000943880A|nr:hypothetical protein [Tsukamurella tyrosinosolvens]VEH89448.1 Uncharacterised protein [Tsukamurella tyrosinosolvens]
MSGSHPCSVPGCTQSTASVTTLCVEHRPSPPVTRDGERIWIGTGLCLAPAAARDLALALADVLEAP